MCLILDKDTYKRLKANEDIIVYKALLCNTIVDGKKILFTPYQRYKVEIGGAYKSRLVKSKSYCPHIKLGFHTFINLPDIDKMFKYLDVNTKAYIAKCVIPKGSHYYIGRYYSSDMPDSYASNKLTYLEIL